MPGKSKSHRRRPSRAAHASRKARKASRGRSYDLVVIAILIAIIIALGAYYFIRLYHLNAALNKFSLFGTTYVITQKSCENVSALQDSNITVSCTGILNESPRLINGSAPAYLIISKYTFSNTASAKFFMDSLSSDLNTSPWNDNIPEFNSSNGIVYTTVVYPNYKGSYLAAEVLAVYRQEGSTVLSVSTSNMTNNASIAKIKLYSQDLLFNYTKQINDTLR